MVKVLVLGSTGLLGSTVAKYFLEHPKYETILSYRDKAISFGKDRVFFDALETNLEILPHVDYIINCIGIIKPFIGVDRRKSVYINSLFPYELASYCEQKNTCLIHITTDCVFSGLSGKYSESSVHDCLDFYGKSKSLGEPTNCMVLRTSIIGEEIHKKASLIEWAKSMEGQHINGFVNHHWNGVTTKQYAKICEQIINEGLFSKGIFHLHSNSVNKCELLQLISERFNLGLKINPYETETMCDRTLVSGKNLLHQINIDTLEKQIRDL